MALYGLGYGAGAMGAGLGAGLVQGMTMAPQLQGLNLANQQRQMSLDEQKAAQQEYALYPKVFSDPSIRDADGNLIPEKVMGMLPHTGAQALGQLGMYQYRQGMANLNQSRIEDIQQKAQQAKLKAMNDQVSSLAGSLLGVSDPDQRYSLWQEGAKRIGADPNSLSMDAMNDETLKQIQTQGVPALRQVANAQNQQRIDAMASHYADMKDNYAASNRVREIAAKAAQARAGAYSREVGAKIAGGTFTRPEALDFESLVSSPGDYYQRPDLALQHIEANRAAQQQASRLSPQDQMALSLARWAEEFQKSTGRRPEDALYNQMRSLISDDFKNATPHMPPAAPATSVAPPPPARGIPQPKTPRGIGPKANRAQAVSDAKAAIAKGADRNAVIARAKDAGIDLSGEL